MAAGSLDLARYALNGAQTTLEARLKSCRRRESSDDLEMELLYQGTPLKAQCNVETIGKTAWETVLGLHPESLLRITGCIELLANKSESTDNKTDSVINGESGKCTQLPLCIFKIAKLVVVAKASAGLPSFDGGELSGPGRLEERLDNRILDQRATASGAMFKLSSGMYQLIVEFMIANGFTWLQTPRIRASHVAGDNEYFHLPYFGRDSWLTQHTQHSLQHAIAMDMQRVFDIGPVFRQDARSNASSRHMSEFTLLGINMAYQDDWHEVVDMIGSMLVFVFRGLQERKQFAALLEKVFEYYPSARRMRIGLDDQGKVPRVTWMDAKRMLREELGIATSDQEDFTPEEEAALGRHFRESPNLGQTDLFAIEHYPLSMRQFNSVRVANAPEFSETWDFILGGREICSGSHRISDYEELCTAMRSGATGPPMDPESEQWRGWMSAFKTGMPPHAGASLGVNRILQGFLGLNEIRETTLFPRDMDRLAP